MQPYGKFSPSFVIAIIAACVAAGLIYHLGFSSNPLDSKNKIESSASESSDVGKGDASSSEATVDLAPSQLSAIKIEPVGTYSFHVEKQAVGSIAYHEKNAADSVLPDSVAVPETTTKFAVANVPESDSPYIHVGQPVEVKVIAYPDRVWTGKVSAVGVTVWDSGGNPAIDPNTHRIAVRCEIADPKNELYPGMLATMAIQIEAPVESLAIPMNGVVRNSDGTMAAWVTTDQHRFVQRILKVGLQKDGKYQVLEGLRQGESVVTDGAVFISNILYAPPTD